MKIEKVWFDHANIYVVLDSGHTVGNPLAWYKLLQKATPAQREQFEIAPGGLAIRWEELDEDISLEGFFDFKRELLYANL